MFQNKNYKKEGFTLIELLTVVAIIGLLASITLAATSKVRRKAEIARARNFDAQVHHALGAYLVAEYKFEGNLKDTSGNNHHGTWKETGGEAPVENFVDNTLLSGKALDLNGIDQYVRIGEILALEPPNLKVTIAAWIYWEGGGEDYAGILGYNSGPDWFYGYDFYICTDPTYGECNSGELAFWYTGMEVAAIAPVAGFINEWHFVAGTYNGTNISVYIDGHLKDTKMDDFHPDYDAEGYIGWDGHGNGNPYYSYFQGAIDELRIYEEELTAAEIRKLYVEGLKKHPTITMNDDNDKI